MANIKISQLTAAASTVGTQEFEVNESGTSKKVTGTQIKTFVKDGLAPSDLTGVTATAAELNYTSGVTSAIQTQLNAKAPLTGTGTSGTWPISITGDAATVDGISIGTLTAAGGIAYATSTTALAATEAGTSGQVLTSNGASAPTWGSPSQLSTASGSAPSYSARAWVIFAGASGTVAGSGNVTSVSRAAAGNYTINFTTAMPNTNYCITGVSSGSSTGSTSISGAGSSGDFSRSTGSVQVFSVDASGNANVDAVTVCVAIFR